MEALEATEKQEPVAGSRTDTPHVANIDSLEPITKEMCLMRVDV
jgi:hypothetical protein